VAGRDLANERNGKMAGRDLAKKRYGENGGNVAHRMRPSTIDIDHGHGIGIYYGIDFSTMLHNTFQSGGYPFSLHMGWGVAVLVLAFIRCHYH